MPSSCPACMKNVLLGSACLLTFYCQFLNNSPVFSFPQHHHPEHFLPDILLYSKYYYQVPECYCCHCMWGGYCKVMPLLEVSMSYFEEFRHPLKTQRENVPWVLLSAQVNHSVLNDIEQYRRNRWYSNIVHIMRNHSGLTKTFLD